MPLAPEPSALYLQVDPQSDMDADTLDHLTRQLHHEIAGLDVAAVDLVKGSAVPVGAKSVEAAVTLGSLAVVVLPTLLPKVVEFLQSWLTRGENRSVKLKLQMQGNSVEVEYSPAGASAADIQGLVGKLTRAMQRPAAS